jgi:SHS family lactate transporter-like MFS transporter
LAAPGFRDVTTEQWHAFWASFLGWVLDGFDFTIVTFLLVDIQRSFDVDKALAGALGTVTLFFRVAGGIGAGTAADKWGRKGPLMFSILWYSLFAFLGGFSTSYRVLFLCRALFGIGMGGVWAAGMPLTLEHWPQNLRGTVSGLLQSGYSTGFMLSSLVYSFAYPMVRGADTGWRVMLWIGILPALLVFWIVRNVRESPVWLERQRHLKDRHERDPVSLASLFKPDLLPITLQASLFMGALLFFYHSITFWYPTLLGQLHRDQLPFLVALNAGGIVGNVVWGRISEGRMGRRGAATAAALLGIAALPLYLFSSTGASLLAGALVMGLTGVASFGIVPGYLNERFPTVARAAGSGLAYHVGAGIAALDPFVIGFLQDGGMALAPAMRICITASGLLAVAFIWLGPETRGLTFRALDEPADPRHLDFLNAVQNGNVSKQNERPEPAVPH